MTVYFLDSSALVKRYIAETGSAWVQQITDPRMSNSLFIARITWVEVISAFARRQRECSITSADFAQVKNEFRADLSNQYQVIELNATIAEKAGQLVERYPLRAYDAVQLASVLFLQSALSSMQQTQLIFLSADNRLGNVASHKHCCSIILTIILNCESVRA